jgi:hypothetical protein
MAQHDHGVKPNDAWWQLLGKGGAAGPLQTVCRGTSVVTSASYACDSGGLAGLPPAPVAPLVAAARAVERRHLSMQREDARLGSRRGADLLAREAKQTITVPGDATQAVGVAPQVSGVAACRRTACERRCCPGFFV